MPLTSSASLVAVHHNLANGTGGRSFVELRDLVIVDDAKKLMCEPVNTTINVILPSAFAETEEERAMHVDVKISDVHLALAKAQFDGVMRTLDGNIQNEDASLRDLFVASNASSEAEKTHAGTRVNLDRNILHFKVAMPTLSVALRRNDSELVTLRAMKTTVKSDILPNLEGGKTESTVMMELLELLDVRSGSEGRAFDKMFSQGGVGGQNNLFELTHAGWLDGKTSLALTIDSPQVVVIPDLINELLDFIDVPGREVKPPPEKTQSSDPSAADLSVKIVTNSSTVILLDEESMTSSGGPCICLKGSFDVRHEMGSNPSSVKTQTEVKGDMLQMFTASTTGLSEAVQILEPADVVGRVERNTSIGEEGVVQEETTVAKFLGASTFDVTASLMDLSLIGSILDSLQVLSKPEVKEEVRHALSSHG